jgi:hypothetical protein
MIGGIRTGSKHPISNGGYSLHFGTLAMKIDTGNVNSDSSY